LKFLFTNYLHQKSTTSATCNPFAIARFLYGFSQHTIVMHLSAVH